METETSINILSVLLGNPLSRRIIAGMNQTCEACGWNHLEIALAEYLGLRDTICPKCRRASSEVTFIIRTGARKFGVSEEDIKTTFRYAYCCKGLVSVMKGIAEFGIHRHFVPGASFQVVFDVTSRCNLRCCNCYASAGKALEDELITEEARQCSSYRSSGAAWCCRA